MTTQNMLVRSAKGGWEKLEPQTTMPEGGIPQILGEDLGQVLGFDAPLVVAAANPKLPGSRPDAICLSGAGDVALVTMALGGSVDQIMPNMLAHAGGLHGMSYDEFEKLCDRAGGKPGDLSRYLAQASKHHDFHAKSFEVAVADALSQGRFQMIAIVGEAPQAMIQTMRFLNASGAAEVLCYEVTSFASSTVTAVQVNPVDVGQKRKPQVMSMSGAGLIAVAEKQHGENMANLVAQLQKYCAANFDLVRYGGDNAEATMTAAMQLNGEDVDVMRLDSAGNITIRFDAVAPHDRDWTVRAELVQGMGRLLGTDLGDARKISQLHLSVTEHLNDATLMECLTDILGDTVPLLREVANAGMVGVPENQPLAS